MKKMYVCEKCGKMFDSYNEAWRCEDSHITSFDVTKTDYTYKEGCTLPETIIISSQEWNSDTNEYDYTFYKASKIEILKGKELEYQQFLQSWNDAIGYNYQYDREHK